MLPSLVDLGLEPGCFLRKLDNQNHWNAYGDQDFSTASQLVAEKVFKEAGGRYSFWKINSEQEFYGVVASLTAGATPRDRNLDFIWMQESELKKVGIEFSCAAEGKCLKVENLHFNAVVTREKAKLLCYDLIIKQRKARRCKKAQTILILENQQNLGCYATDSHIEVCTCQK
jgi:hypothetical protein